MALYPPPSANVPTFNVDLFSNTIGYGANNYATSLAFPTAQGTETWTNGVTTTTISDSAISSTTLAFGAPAQGLSFNYNGIDTVTGTTLKIGDTTASGIAIGSSTAGRTPTITIDTLSTANTNASPAIAIGTSSSTKTIKIGSNTNSVHCSSIDLQGSAINNITATTGAISIGNNQTDGILNLGTNSGRTATGVINIGNSTSLAPINILTVSTKVTETDPAINIGGGASNKWIKIGSSLGGQNNIVSAANLRVRASPSGCDINGVTQASTTIFLGNNQTSGVLNLGCGVGPDIAAIRAAGADVNIATGASTACNVNILNGATSGGNVNIASGSGITQTTAVAIGSGSTTGTVTIGNSANAVALNGSVTLAKPLILGTVPTANTQLGYIINSALTASVVLATNSSTTQSIASFTLPIGTWQCSYQLRYYNPTGTTTMTAQAAYMLLTTRQTNYGTVFGWNGNYGTNWVITTAGVFLAQGSATIYTSVSNTLTLYTESTYTGTAPLNAYADAVNIQTYLMAVRIA